MKEIRSEIDIAAPATTVWSVLTSFDKWSDWNPIVKEVQGVATRGSKLQVSMQGKEGQPGQQYLATITTFEEPLFFRWRAKMLAEFLFANDKVFELKEIPSGTKLVHTEAFSGLLVSLFWGKLSQYVPDMLKSMNAAVKRAAESQEGSS